VGWCYTDDQPLFDAAARLHHRLPLWWVLWSAPQRQFYGFWCGPQAIAPVRDTDEDRFLAQIAAVERELLGAVVSVPALASPTERLLLRCRAAGVAATVLDDRLRLRLDGHGTAQAALRPDPGGGGPRWWVSWTDATGAHARPIAAPGHEDLVLAHVLHVLTAAPAHQLTIH
jgi:hypothetical protein